MILRRCKQCRGLIYERDGLSVDPGCGIMAWKDQEAFVYPYAGSQNKSATLPILARMMIHGPASTSQLVDWLYADREDGGPDDAPRAVRAVVLLLRRRIEKVRAPIKISQRWKFGYTVEITREAA